MAILRAAKVRFRPHDHDRPGFGPIKVLKTRVSWDRLSRERSHKSTCAYCGDMFERASTGRPRRWCSDQCRERARPKRNRWAERRPENNVPDVERYFFPRPGPAIAGLRRRYYYRGAFVLMEHLSPKALAWNVKRLSRREPEHADRLSRAWHAASQAG
jgi:hypothetical protein